MNHPLSTPAGPIPPTAPRWNRQRASQMPSARYSDVFSKVEVPLAERAWPEARITQAPLWVPVDLRDGNQALAEPMDPHRKRAFFELLVAMGYKEIEVGYPSASGTDYDFVRLLAQGALAPSDVTLVVFTPARRDLIKRTVASIEGITNDVVIHLYTATAPLWRDTVLGKSREELLELILAGARDVYELAGHLPNVRFEFSPEVFNLTEPEYALQVCDAVTDLWQATPERPVILNLPATVEVATPNVYADQIEFMHRHLSRREAVILSVHPHNDRGTGVACAELAVLAGAQRVEGCLFGNGERTGNVDLVTLALNLHAQGVDPQIDFSEIDHIRRIVEDCNRIDVHARHPYVGDLVHTAFSGTHQDAIKKGLAEHTTRAHGEGLDPALAPWRVPYLPIDPSDVGRSYDAVIRVNSQSGKGGIAYLLESEYGLELPRRLQIDFARHVQSHTDSSGGEVSASQLWQLFQETYLSGDSAPGADDIRLERYSIEGPSSSLTLRCGEVSTTHSFDGRGPVESLAAALSTHGIDLEVLELHQTSIGAGNSTDALSLIEFRRGTQTGWAAGLHRSVLEANFTAVLRAATGHRAGMRVAH
jgi:2-isopropylmalate synthase